MQRYVVILLLFLTTISSAMADTTSDLIQRVDSIMDNISQIYGKKQARIDFYKNMAEKSRKPETLLSAYDKLYDEYFVFQFDSAMVYVDKAIQLADRIGDKYHHDKSRIEKASLLAVGGLYGEAMGLLGEIDSVKLDEDLRFTYTITHYYVYTYWADYCHDNMYSPRYRERADSYLKQAVAMLRPTDSYYDFFWGEYYIYVERNDQRALRHYFNTLKTAPVESRWYAMAAYAVANNYSANNDYNKYEEYMLRACISDLLNCTRENLAMQDLAMYMFKKGDDNILLAERYINFAMDDAKNYNNRLRIIEISQKLPIIVSTYREKLSSQNSLMRMALLGVSVLCVFVVVLLYFYSRQNRQLARHRHELSESNSLLSSLNEKLNSLNSRLLDTNSRRERLAKLYIDLCAKYIDRLSKFEVLVKRKIKVGQVNDLLNTASSSRLSEEDAATFMNSFDTAFLDLYPSFVTEFNALLREDEQIVPPHKGRLTTELRIYALIRLGVKESSEIAALLFYTPRTIYNYRSTIKSRARNRETFESDVEQLCRVIHAE
ncbi:DUF6377 domain-containing protein [Prevotella sp.]|uniref:DUF6377 domain-containing protein n=1 Tax=Prevotella sp. TaxID=59823 RepID=UPI0025E67F87|nr:DUF6377 domain-containing protein [Prevotella sp.]